jgi:carboxylesterase type B
MTGGTPEAAELAGRISDAWIALAALPSWKPYSRSARATMLINFESHLAADPEREERILLSQLNSNP